MAHAQDPNDPSRDDRTDRPVPEERAADDGRSIGPAGSDPVSETARFVALFTGVSGRAPNTTDIRDALRLLGHRRTTRDIEAVRAAVWHLLNRREPLPADFTARRSLDGVQVAEPAPGVLVWADGSRRSDRRDYRWQRGDGSWITPTEEQAEDLRRAIVRFWIPPIEGFLPPKR